MQKSGKENELSNSASQWKAFETNPFLHGTEPSGSFSEDFRPLFSSFLKNSGFAHEQGTNSDIVTDLRGFEFDWGTLFSSFATTADTFGLMPYAEPQNGLFGPLYRRLQVYISPQFRQVRPLVFLFEGATLRAGTVRPFTGEVSIDHIFHSSGPLSPSDTSTHTIVAHFSMSEDPSLEGSGVFQGLYTANAKVQISYDFHSNHLLRLVFLDNSASASPAYHNRSCVAIWRSYHTGESLRAIWGDGRLPFAFDLYTDGQGTTIAPKYCDADWNATLDTSTEHQRMTNSEGQFVAWKRKTEWWK